jgi:hypothetical protein
MEEEDDLKNYMLYISVKKFVKLHPAAQLKNEILSDFFSIVKII